MVTLDNTSPPVNFQGSRRGAFFVELVAIVACRLSGRQKKLLSNNSNQLNKFIITNR